MSLLASEPLLLTLALVASFMVGLSKGGLVNVGMVAVPIMAMAMPPISSAALLLPVYLISDVVGVWLYRRHFSLRNLAILIPAGICGVCIGWFLALRVPDDVIVTIVGLIGSAYCLDYWLRRRDESAVRPADIPRGLVWGALTGFTSFITHSGGPTYQVYVLPQRLEKRVFAGTTTILFATINASKVIPYWYLQQFGNFNLVDTAMLLPVALAGTFAGAWLVRTIPTTHFFSIIRIVLFVVSLKLIADGVSGLLAGWTV